jgi:hypothetical protein
MIGYLYCKRFLTALLLFSLGFVVYLSIQFVLVKKYIFD